MNTETQSLPSTINPNYWRRYGFNRDPFSEAAQKEFFVPASWEEYLDLLPQFARFCDTLLLIIGRPKVGKTTLINLFTNEQGTDTDIFTLRASDCPSANHFLQLLNQRYGAPYDASNPAPASEQLHQQLEFLREQKASRLLIIDDAEKLPLDMRQLCLQIIQQQNALTTCLPIILVGEDQLSEQMHALLTPTTAQKCLYIVHVEPFSEDETEQYLRWCCEQAAGDKHVEFPFDPEDVATIFQQSNGVIGEINPAAQRLLSSRTKSGVALPPFLRGKIMWWGGAIIIIIILLVIYQQLTKPSNVEQSITSPVSTNPPAANPPTANPSTPTTSTASATPATASSSASATNATPTANAATTPTAPANTETQGASSEDLPHTSAPTTIPTNTTSTADTSTSAKIVGVPGSAAAPVATAAETDAPTTPVSVKTTTPTEPVKTTPVQKAPPHVNLFNETMSAELREHQTRVLHTPPNHFTLQLIASPNLHIVQKFVLKHQLGSVALIVPTERNGKFYYIVLYGNFPTRAIAEQSHAQLKKKKQVEGWIRTYKSVQELITTGKPIAPAKTVHRKIAHKKTAETTSNSENW